MTSSANQGLPTQADFEQFFREAVSITFNIQCLQGVLKPLSEGDGEYLQPILGDVVLLQNAEHLSAPVALCWQIIHGISILKPLAAELFLKALIASHQPPPKIHDLAKLHDELDANEQSRLDGLFRKHFQLAEDPQHPHVQLPSFGSVMRSHKDDFVGVRYGETVSEYLTRTQDGMSNITAAIGALREACLTHPAAAGWMKSPPQSLGSKF